MAGINYLNPAYMNHKSYFNRFVTYLFCLMALVGYGQTAQAQGRVVTGTITDVADGNGLPGANVLVKGTANGTTTDASGKFRLSIPTGNVTLVISSVGYAAQEVPVGNSSTINVTLQSDNRALNEVVVVGYGQK